MGVTVSSGSEFCRWYQIQEDNKRAKYKSIKHTTEGQIVSQATDISDENAKKSQLFIIKHFSTIQKSVYKQLFSQCLKTKKKRLSNICRITQVQEIILNQFCSTQYSVKAIFEHYELSLSMQLRKKICKKEYFSSVYILEVFRFLLDLIFESRKNDMKITELSLEGIKITSQKKFKYRNPLEDEYFSNDVGQRLIYFPPQQIRNNNSVIFSIGMVLLALCLNDDCRDCYEYKTMSFCWSLLEEKLMNLQSNQRKMPDLFIEGIYGMLYKDPMQRMTLDQVSDLYTQILRQLRNQGDKSLNILKQVTSHTNIQNENISCRPSSKNCQKPYYDEIIRHL